jgi:regulator-associated protein of mTOR
VCGTKDQVTVWDVKATPRKFSESYNLANHSKPIWTLDQFGPPKGAKGTGTSVCALEFLNEDAYALLAVGTTDGVVRIWRDIVPYTSAYGSNSPSPTQCMSWRALSDLMPGGKRDDSDLVFKWISTLGCLAVAGAARSVKLWDLERDQPVHELHTRSAAPMTGLVCDVLHTPNVLALGGGDGCVRVLDIRARPTENQVMVLREHRAWVVGVDMQQRPPAVEGAQSPVPESPLLLSASIQGDVKFWDLRKPNRSVRTLDVYGANASLTTLAVHPYAPIGVAGSAAYQFKLLDLSLQSLDPNGIVSTINQYDGFLGLRGTRLGRVSSTVFHPLSPVLAVGAGGTQNQGQSIISLYKC